MKYQIKNFLLISVIFLSSAFGITGSLSAQKKANVKNIILFIGDGMGTAQVYAGMTVSPTPFYLLQFPYSGFSITYSSDNYITDSAAGGTAISSGVKTKNGMIGVKPDGSVAKNIIEYAHEKGLATGVLSTSAITHATPASFVAHNSGRGNYEDIAKDFLNGTADVFIGGGQDHFMKRKDGRDLVSELKQNGYEYASSLDELVNAKGPKLAGLLAKEHMPKVMDGRAGALEAMVRKAIEILSKDKDGFFLMVEGSMIDWGAHEKNIDYVTSEMVDLDKAIGEALNFARTNKETLIVVTADHETGGLTLTGGSIEDHKVVANFSQSDHTSVMVPIFSYGPRAERFSGIHQNTSFLENFLELLKIRK